LSTHVNDLNELETKGLGGKPHMSNNRTILRRRGWHGMGFIGVSAEHWRLFSSSTGRAGFNFGSVSKENSIVV
jgi:hypothetical protein